MELIERDEFLEMLQSQFEKISEGEGHCIFVSGEAGIGKTSLVKKFCSDLRKSCDIYQGTCDALFTPRPLAPLYDIMWQVNHNLSPTSHTIEERFGLFSGFFRELSNQKKKSVVIFEDIHWADEATLDFIKFFARRIVQLPCLFILTYRDDEMNAQHPLRNVLGQLPPDSFSRLQLTTLSRQAVEKMASEKGYSGEDVYSISGGNPFYVNEILASYSLGIPDNIKNSVLSTYNNANESTKQVWELLSVIPARLEIKYLAEFEPLYASIVDSCLDTKILIIDDGCIYFKHELFRRTIETSLSPLKKVSLNKRILDLLREKFEQSGDIERIIHHAKNANEYETVVRYAPLAAAQAASVGAHTEASKLYLMAIDYYEGDNSDLLVQFYESYAYECYLTSQVKEAIIYAEKLLNLYKQKDDPERTCKTMRFLSRLWWRDGNWKVAKEFAEQAIEVVSSRPDSSAKSMAFSNMSQLKMLFDQPDESIAWEKAIALALEVGDEETHSHALNNVGSVYMNMKASEQKGIALLQQSLEIALKNSFYEHAARAYSNMGSNALKMKNYAFAKKILEEGINYCEERGLEASRSIMLSLKAVLHLETGDWKNAYSIADNLLKNENHLVAFTGLLPVPATIRMRKGDTGVLPLLLDAAAKAFETTELQRIIPSLIALLEYEWLTGKKVINEGELERGIIMIGQSIYSIEKNEFAFWLRKARKRNLQLDVIYAGYDVSNVKKVREAAALWEKAGNPYVQALTLFEGTDDDKRKAIKIVHELGANAIYEKMKLEMRISGIKNIPRGIRKSTQSNPALLTDRELNVLQLLNEGLQNKEIAARLFISVKTVDNHISSIFYKLEVNSRTKAVHEATRLEIIK